MSHSVGLCNLLPFVGFSVKYLLATLLVSQCQSPPFNCLHYKDKHINYNLTNVTNIVGYVDEYEIRPATDIYQGCRRFF